MHEALQSAADNQLFQATAAPFLLVDTDLRIQAVNQAYLTATMRDRVTLDRRDAEAHSRQVVGKVELGYVFLPAVC